MKAVEIFEQKPLNFEPQVEVSAAYIKAQDKYLFMQLSQAKVEYNKWGVPAGKCEPFEKAEEGLKRELYEETGIKLSEMMALKALGALYIEKPNFRYTYHLFEISCDKIPDVQISEEHISFKWVSEEEVKDLDLMCCAREGFEAYLNRRSH
ncbi:putative Nudix hydrolase yvcI [Chlamydiales bacterium STE3]|nr:putative Nudix hydrolase yvcI [Chlamydiales bacterium STE3]